MSFVADPHLSVRSAAIHLFAKRGDDDEKAMISMLRYSASQKTASVVGEGIGRRATTSMEKCVIGEGRLQELQWKTGLPKPVSPETWLDLASERLLSDGGRRERIREVEEVLSEGDKDRWESPALEKYLKNLYSEDWKLRKHAVEEAIEMGTERYERIECIVLGFVADPHPEVVTGALDAISAHKSKYWRRWVRAMEYSKVEEISKKARELSVREGE